MSSLEDCHFWYAALRHVVLATAAPLLKGKVRPAVLDAGCGTGGMSAVLKENIPELDMVGMDFHPLAIEYARKKTPALRLARASVTDLPFAGESFDLVLSLDVLYIRRIDPLNALSEFYRVLKRGACLILNLPAFECLRGEHDAAVDTGRRYAAREVAALVRRAGLEMEFLTYWNTAFFPFLACWRMAGRLLHGGKSPAPPRSDLRPLPGVVNRLLAWYLIKETQIAQRWPLPFGSSIFAVARKN